MHVKASLCIGHEFHEHVDDDILIDEEMLNASSYVDSNSDTEEVHLVHYGDDDEAEDYLEN